MFRRRLTTFVAASALALAFTVPAMAQEAGGSVTINLMTCTVTGTADSVSIQASSDPGATLRDCVAGWPGSADSLTVDGGAPDVKTSSAAEWAFLPDGDHVADSGDGTGPSAFPFTIDGEDVELWAFWAKHEVPTDETPTAETTPTETATEEATVTVTEEAAAVATETPADEDSTAEKLPKTGSGPESTSTGVGLALAAAAGIAALGARQARRRS